MSHKNAEKITLIILKSQQKIFNRRLDRVYVRAVLLLAENETFGLFTKADMLPKLKIGK